MGALLKLELTKHITKKPKNKPWLLSQSNIPKPLHGVNPRTIMGKDEWDKFRRKVYASTGYHCAACGVHQIDAMFHKWLEAHEDYEIDHRRGRMTVRSVEPLCHACHSFIHSGFLFVQLKKEMKSRDDVKSILKHGFKVLESAKLPAFIGLKNVIAASGYKDSWHGEWIYPEKSNVSWQEWRMVWMGKEHKPLFNSMKEWQRHYS